MSVKVEVLLKTSILILMATSLFILSITVINLLIGDGEILSLEVHRLVGVALFILVPLHMLLRLGKIRKLSREFISTLKGKEPKMNSTKDKLVGIVEGKTLEEFAQTFAIEKEDLEEYFNIKRYNLKQGDTFKEICKKNRDDEFKLLTSILEHFKK